MRIYLQIDKSGVERNTRSSLGKNLQVCATSPQFIMMLNRQESRKNRQRNENSEVVNNVNDAQVSLR